MAYGSKTRRYYGAIGLHVNLTLYQPMTHICVISSHKPIIIYMGGLILGANTLYRLFCFFELLPMVGKGLRDKVIHVSEVCTPQL